MSNEVYAKGAGFLYNGYRVHINSSLVKDGEPKEVSRAWFERLFTRPWQPLKKTKTVIPKVPSREVIVDKIHMAMHMHPVVYEQFKQEFGGVRE